MEQCKMLRTEQMKESLKDIKKQLERERLKKIKTICADERKKTVETLKSVLGKFSIKENTGVFVFSYLRSSCITGNHDFLLSYYKDEPFMDENPEDITVDMSALFAGIAEDYGVLNRYLSEKYVRVFPSEREEIRRWYLLEIYKNMGDIVREMIEKMGTRVKKVIYYGGYMEGDLKEVGQV